jgi:tRNA/tmRNA/rRNA uracil-C5-methylase (TrmA/RlmC/RlmD family)
LRGKGVETVRSCASAATEAAREQLLDRVTFSQGDAVELARNWLTSAQSFALVVLDPPRAGVRSGLDSVSKLARSTIVCCSCNSESLLRNLSTLQQLGWHVEELTAFNMFPGTRHLEIVAWLAA